MLLARQFLTHFASQYRKEIYKISRPVESARLAYAWPGNIRELENVIGRACMLARTRMLNWEDLPEEVRTPPVAPGELDTTLAEAEKQAVMRVLQETKKKALAAGKLGVNRPRLYRLMAKYGLAEYGPTEESLNESSQHS